MSLNHTPSKMAHAPTSANARHKSWRNFPGASLLEGVRTKITQRKTSQASHGSNGSNRSKSPEWDWRLQGFTQLDPDPGGGGGGSFGAFQSNTLSHNGGGSNSSPYLNEIGRADTLPKTHHVNGVVGTGSGAVAVCLARDVDHVAKPKSVCVTRVANCLSRRG